MTVERAFRLLKLPADATHKQLLMNYRRLVKRIHPDYNAHRQEWSHKAMTTINLAYETVRDYLHESQPEAHVSHDAPETAGATERAEEQTADTSGGHAGEQRREAEVSVFPQHFASAINAVLNGMYLYYQYGLENIHLRHEGVRRFRYRSALKQIESGLDKLNALESSPKRSDEMEHFLLFRNFTKAFLQNMRINKYYIAQRMPGEHKAYQHYSNGSIHLDKAIKSRFFDELETSFQERSIAGGLKISYHEFMTVLVKYANSTWIPETVIKIYLLELFQKVARLDMAG